MNIFDKKRLVLSTGVELDIVDLGDRDAPVLIFLHGFPESHRTWREQLPFFQNNYRVIAPDQRGYCQSSKPLAVENYTVDKLTADVFAIADALSIAKFTIVGHDWGGALAWSVALHGEMRVERLVILNAPHPYLFASELINNPSQRAASQYMRIFNDKANDSFIEEHGLDAFLKQAAKWNGHDDVGDAEKQLMLDNWSEPGAAIAMLNWYRASAIFVPAMDEDVIEPDYLGLPFPKIEIPTLVIWGMDDIALQPSLLDGLDDMVLNLTLKKVANCRHFIPWEAPEKVNPLMQEWLLETQVT